MRFCQHRDLDNKGREKCLILIKTAFGVPVNTCSEQRAQYKDAVSRQETRVTEKFVSVNKRRKILRFGMDQ